MTHPDLETLKDGVIVFFLTTETSEFGLNQKKFLDTNSSETVIVFVDSGNIPEEIQQVFQQNQNLQKKKSFGDLILFTIKKEGKISYLQHREKPESKHNWVLISHTFEKHYLNTQPDDDGVWKWGQIVPEDGEYLCRDCGYIEDFKAGDIFPVCEVCLAGDPEGPLEITDGFWEKL